MISSASTNLACLAVENGAGVARVYYSDPDGHIWELARLSERSPGWIPTDLTAATANNGKARLSAGHALTCCGVDGGAAARVYFTDHRGHIWQLAESHTEGWVATDITVRATGNPPAAGVDTTLACFAVDGSAPRVYFLDDVGHVWELAWRHDINRWGATDLTDKAAGNPPPAAPHALACYGANGRDPRVYVHDGLGTGHVWELAWWDYAQHWIAFDITERAGNPARAAWGSDLACFGAEGTGPRVYFLELDYIGDGHVWELASWDNTNKWAATDITDRAGAQPVSAGSTLACLPLKKDGSALRIYFIDANGHVCELAWDNGWSVTDMTVAASVPFAVIARAVAQSALAGLNADGHPRLYHVIPGDPDSIAELAWQGRWINRTLWVVGEPTNFLSSRVGLPFDGIEKFRPNGEAPHDDYSDDRDRAVALWW